MDVLSFNSTFAPHGRKIVPIVQHMGEQRRRSQQINAADGQSGYRQQPAYMQIVCPGGVHDSRILA